jgi:hypothetical protein
MYIDLRHKRKNIRCLLTIVIILLFIIFFLNYGNGLTYNGKYLEIEENVGIIGYISDIDVDNAPFLFQSYW